jgi:hypothetical protein
VDAQKVSIVNHGVQFWSLTQIGISKAVQRVVDQLDYRASDPFVGHGVATLESTHVQVVGRQPLPNLVWMADGSRVVVDDLKRDDQLATVE